MILSLGSTMIIRSLSAKEKGGKEMTFGQFIKVFMTDAGMNQKQLAEKIGISTPVMCDILTNRRGFTTKQAKKCEEIFGVPAVIFMMMYDLKKLEEERK